MKDSNLSRRSFLSMTSLAVLGAGLGLVGCAPRGQSTDSTPETKPADEPTTKDSADTTDKKEGAAAASTTKPLVLYFSYSGNTETMARWIADETGGGLVRVTAKEAYPDSYDETVDRAKREQDEGTRPEINVDLTAEQLAGYDTVFFGFPIWWYDLPMPMYTFLENNNLAGKTVIPFFSHGGSSTGANSLPNLESLAKGATVKSGDAISILGDEVAGSEKDVRDWAKGFSQSS